MCVKERCGRQAACRVLHAAVSLTSDFLPSVSQHAQDTIFRGLELEGLGTALTDRVLPGRHTSFHILLLELLGLAGPVPCHVSPCLNPGVPSTAGELKQHVRCFFI